jgi:hypothetical protein
VGRCISTVVVAFGSPEHPEVRVEYRVETTGANGRLRTALRRWEIRNGMRSTALLQDSKPLADQTRPRVTLNATREAHRLAAGDLEAVRLALAGLAAARHEIPCPRIDEGAYRAALEVL